MKQVSIITILVFILVTQLSWAQIPQTMSYQGMLTDAGGGPVADGSYDLTFSLYEADTGGAAPWTETQSVAVVNGVFNVILGSVNPLTPDFSMQYWLGIAIGAGGELTPRIQLVSSPYSLNSRSVADGAVTEDKIAANAVTSGKIDDDAVGTTKIATDAVTGDKIADGQVVRNINDLKDGVILAEGTNVTIEKSGNTLTISATIADGSVTSGKIAGDAVTTFHILNGTILAEDVGFNYADSTSPAGPATDLVSSGAVDTTDIADDAVTGDKIADGQVVGSINGKTDDVTLAEGTNVTITPSGNTLTISSSSSSFDGWSLTGNAGTNPATNFLGTTDNVPLELRVHGQRILRLEYVGDSGRPNIIGGYDGNSVANGIHGATISGGGAADYINTVITHFGTIGGGAKNTASGWGATVSGGYGNTASGLDSMVGGGDSNIASGSRATIPGGMYNTAQGDYSFAAGFRAKANHQGSFVWGDSIDADVASNVPDSFTVRASGGTWLYSNSDLTSGVKLPANSTALDTISNVPLEFRVNGVRALRLEHAEDGGSEAPTIIGGYSGNSVGADVIGATIFGGGRTGTHTFANSVNGNYGTVSGGKSNTASGHHTTVGGGGDNDTAREYATVGGGYLNTASGHHSTVGGGGANTAGGPYSMVAGGVQNKAWGMYSFAAGHFAHANHQGSFVWSDYSSTGAITASTGPDQFVVSANGGAYLHGPGLTVSHSGDAMLVLEADTGNVDEYANPGIMFIQDGGIVTGFLGYQQGTNRLMLTNMYDDHLFLVSAGGVYVYSNSAATSGVRLTPGSSSWSGLSDRTMKRNIRQVDVKDVLTKLSEVPISQWSYKTQDPSVEHIGPMAQDFYAAFGLDEDDRYISTVDADGVALAAIQGLYELVKEKDAEIDAQQETIATMEARLKALEELVLR